MQFLTPIDILKRSFLCQILVNPNLVAFLPNAIDDQITYLNVSVPYATPIKNTRLFVEVTVVPMQIDVIWKNPLALERDPFV